MDKIIEINDISFGYSRRRGDVLRNFSLDIEPGGVYGLLGRNGAGKSTLLYLMCGLLRAQSGIVKMGDMDVARCNPATLSDTYIVPEEFELPSVTMKEYVKLNAGFYPRFSESLLASCLSQFDMDADVNLGQLSMGQKKKAFMSFALAANTRLLLMDEPTNGFDIPSKSQMRKVIASGMTDDRAIVISTHQVRDVENLLDRVVIIDNRHLLLNRRYDEILSKIRFDSVSSDCPLEEAIYSQPSLNGYSGIFPNEGDEESQMNLEMLFNAMLAEPNKMQAVLNVEPVK